MAKRKSAGRRSGRGRQTGEAPGHQVIQPQVDCSTAREFLDALSPLGPHFSGVRLEEPWLFRGQDGDYPLVPSAFRGPDKWADLTHRNVNDPGELRLAQRDVLIQFFEIADRRGLILPDDSQELRVKLDMHNSERGDRFGAGGHPDWGPSDMSLSLMALAQHYGVPTALLDWTRRSDIAAFFAAEHAPKRCGEGGDPSLLVVWAFYFPFFGKHDFINRLSDPVQIVTAPSATNPNLKAQQGVFTLTHSNYSWGRRGDWEGSYWPLEEMLDETAKEGDPGHSDAVRSILGCRLRKFTLPSSERKTLLCLLSKLDVTPSTIYPGYHSIIHDMRMRCEFSRRGGPSTRR